MDYKIIINEEDKLTKVLQIVNKMIQDIDKGILERNTQVASINQFSKSHKVARETVEKAYKILRKDGYLISVPGKGNFVGKGPDNAIKIMMILNKMSSYKKEVYEAFIEELGERAQVNLQIHHYDPKIFREIILDNQGKYHYYVIMPHFFSDTQEEDYLDVLKGISPGELVILDKKINLEGDFISVFQDFKMDIFEVMTENSDLFDKYESITVIFPEHSNHPLEIIAGIRSFCSNNRKKFIIVSSVQDLSMSRGEAFVALTETDLASLIKKVRTTDLKIGQDIGIVSFNETVLKELLGITVVTTDFLAMGKKAAQMIIFKQFEKVRNSFRLIKRESL